MKDIAAILNGTSPAAEKKSADFSAADLKFDASGLPRVPDPILNVNGRETNATQQQIIRIYMTKHYSESFHLQWEG
jgi:hypothetical protein